MDVIACVGLGANLGDAAGVVRAAQQALGELPETRLLAASRLYRTAAWGKTAQPDFINAAVLIETRLPARALLDALLAIERRHGRVRDFQNAPRTLDLDIVMYSDATLDEPGLTIPHPRMHERAFVLVPLAEIAPDTIVRGRGRAKDLLSRIDTSGITHAGAVDSR